MGWFFLALVGPLMYALSNHIDKILLSKYFKEGGVGTLILFSSLFALLVLPFIFLADKTVVDINCISILVLTSVGILNVMVLWCWFMALQTEEASVGVVFYQLVPVFGCILGYFILGEELTWTQIVAMAIVIIGTLLISFEIGGEKNETRFRWRTVFLMSAAALFWAAGAVLFKVVALEEKLWRTIFWEHLTLGIVGVGIFLFMPSYRRSFLSAIRENTRGILGLNGANESLYVFGNLAYSIAYMMAPIGLVLLAESFQPFFVFIIGTFLTVFFPKVVQERIRSRDLAQKALAICVTGFGVYLLSA